MAKRKLPWMKWHPRDWLSEPTLRRCSIAARGAWMDLLMYMEADDTPQLSCTMLEYAQMLGVDYDTACALVMELIAKGVCDSDFDPLSSRVTEHNGPVTLLSRRYVREHKARESNRKRQARFRKRRESNTACNGGDSESDSESDSEQDSEEGSGPPEPGPDPVAAVPYDDILEAWNNIAAIAGCKAIRKLTAARKRKLRIRWRDPDWRANWLEAINLLPERRFACGENDRGWRMDFNFFLKPDTVTKLLEGAYEGKPAAPKSTRPEDVWITVPDEESQA